MFVLRQPWKYDILETDDGLWIVEKGEMGSDKGVIVLDDIDLESEEIKSKPWTFMLDGMEHLYK